jgi:hypothetical protein
MPSLTLGYPGSLALQDYPGSLALQDYPGSLALQDYLGSLALQLFAFFDVMPMYLASAIL